MPCVDLGESFPTNICLQILASIQPGTGLSKFAKKNSLTLETKVRINIGIEFCLERRVDPNYEDIRGHSWTALLYAAAGGHGKVGAERSEGDRGWVVHV